jgi:hypothetical protein
MKLLKYLFLTLVGIAALWVLLCLFAKKSYRVERSLDIYAPKATVYDQVRLFKNFTNWSPWHFMDPNMKISIEGTDGEPGAVYRWESQNENVGKGYQKLITSTPARVDYEVDFGLAPSPVYFILDGDSIKTSITWGMDLHLPFFMRAGGMFTDLNMFVGKDYENVLAHLKKYCEALNPKEYRGFRVKAVEREEAWYVAFRDTVEFQSIPQFIADKTPLVLEAAGKAGVKADSMLTGMFWTYDTVLMNTNMAVAFGIDKQMKPAPGVEVIKTGGNAIIIDFLGDFGKTAEAHMAMDEYMAERKLQQIPPILEEYLTDPTLEPDTSKWLTRIVYFVKPLEESTKEK